MMSNQHSNSSNAPATEHLRRSFYATKPTGITRFLRTFLPYQLWRFVWINLRMMGIIRAGHKGQQ
ncbi:MAG: hypothetical protein ABFS37_05025 [Acidobacteriota bacterium]